MRQRQLSRLPMLTLHPDEVQIKGAGGERPAVGVRCRPWASSMLNRSLSRSSGHRRVWTMTAALTKLGPSAATGADRQMVDACRPSTSGALASASQAMTSVSSGADAPHGRLAPWPPQRSGSDRLSWSSLRPSLGPSLRRRVWGVCARSIGPAATAPASPAFWGRAACRPAKLLHEVDSFIGICLDEGLPPV